MKITNFKNFLNERNKKIASGINNELGTTSAPNTALNTAPNNAKNLTKESSNYTKNENNQSYKSQKEGILKAIDAGINNMSESIFYSNSYEEKKAKLYDIRTRIENVYKNFDHEKIKELLNEYSQEANKHRFHFSNLQKDTKSYAAFKKEFEKLNITDDKENQNHEDNERHLKP